MTLRSLIVGALGIIIKYAADHEIEPSAAENRQPTGDVHECQSFGWNVSSA